MNHDYSSPDFMGNAYVPGNGTLTGTEIQGGGASPNSKKTMVGDVDAPTQGNKKRVTTLAGFLVSFSSSDIGEYWELREGNNAIGTDKSSEIVLSEKHVSSNHATINISRDTKNNCWKFQIVDKSSSNGTFVNGERLDIYQGFTLKDKDRLKVGEYEFMLFSTDRFVHGLIKNPAFVGNKTSADYSDTDWSGPMNNNTIPSY